MLGLKKKEAQVKLKETIITQLKTVFDPELPVNIYDLGLIYDIAIKVISKNPPKYHIHIQMTLTTPNCPVAETLPRMVEQAVLLVSEVDECIVELVWEPPWGKERMSDIARLELDMFY